MQNRLVGRLHFRLQAGVVTWDPDLPGLLCSVDILIGRFHTCFLSFPLRVPFFSCVSPRSLPSIIWQVLTTHDLWTYGWSSQNKRLLHDSEVNTEVKVSPLAFLPEMEAERSERQCPNIASMTIPYTVQDIPWVVGGAEIILWQSCMLSKYLNRPLQIAKYWKTCFGAPATWHLLTRPHPAGLNCVC